MAAEYLYNTFDSVTNNSIIKQTIILTLQESLYRLYASIRKKHLKNPKGKSKIKEKKEFKVNSLNDKSFKFSQKEYLANFKEKAEENKSLAMRLIKEQKERKERQEKRDEKVRQKLQQEQEYKEKLQKIEKFNQEKLKKDQILHIMEKSKERKKNIQFLKELGEKEYKKATSSTPLYKKLESDFFVKIQLPELEKRKEELQRKREYFKPLDHDELRYHAKRFDSMLLALSEQKKQNKPIFFHRTKSLNRSKMIKKLLEDEQQKIKEEQDKKNWKKDLLSKRKNYAELVKEVFQPTPDMLKIQEMELIKARLNSPVKIKLKGELNLSDQEIPSEINRSVSVGPKKFKKNKMVPETKTKKTPVVKDYIQEFRQARKKSLSGKFDINWQEDLLEDIPQEEKIKKLHEKISFFDREARKNELKIGIISPNNSKCLEISEHVNSLIINSIKAKLAILENN